jgi:hypothetical protein
VESVAVLLLPTALKGAVTTSPVVLTVVVTMLPAVFTGTVTSEQAGRARHRSGRTAWMFMRRI